MSRRRDEIQAAVNSSIDDETSSMCTLLFTQIRVILVLDVLQRRFPTIHNFQYSSFIWHEAVISFNLPVGIVDLVSESGCVGHAQIKFNAIFYDNWNAKNYVSIAYEPPMNEMYQCALSVCRWCSSFRHICRNRFHAEAPSSGTKCWSASIYPIRSFLIITQLIINASTRNHQSNQWIVWFVFFFFYRCKSGCLTYNHEVESESLAACNPAHLILEQIQSYHRWRHLFDCQWRHFHVITSLRL